MSKEHHEFMYRDFGSMGRSLIRTLRRNHNAVVVYPSGFNIDGVITYLKERGYKANPRLDRNLQYYTDRTIDEVNDSNVLMQRIIAKGRKWS